MVHLPALLKKQQAMHYGAVDNVNTQGNDLRPHLQEKKNGN